jgi:oligoribonuclease NrnB/cAMP/cGMP phosphodiesterase (DHH superfamily)
VQRVLEQWSTLEVEKDEFVRERVDVQTVSGVTVAFAIGDCRQGVLPYTILDECSDVDLVVVVKPSGKMSLKCRTGLDIAKRVAVELGGGGHSTRAGATYDGTVQMPDARDVKQHICEAIQTVSE